MLKKLKNSLIYSLLKAHDLFFPTRFRSSIPSRVLVISTTALGDTLWATPFVKSLKRSFPSCRISIMTSSVGSLVLKHNPYVDDCIIIQKESFPEWIQTFRFLRQEHFDTVFILHASQRIVFPLAYLSRAGKIYGSKGQSKDLDKLLTDSCDPQGKHQIEKRLDLLSLAGGKVLDSKMDFYLDKDSILKAETYLKEHQLTDIPIIGIHPGSSHPGTQWPASHYRELVKKLAAEFKGKIIISGTAKEKALVESICRDTPQTIALIGSLDLLSFGALIKHYSLLITNDTGPLHVATALHVPSIGLFASANSEETGPYKVPSTHIIQKPRTCQPCIKKRCREPFCLLQISPEEVLKKAKEIVQFSHH